MKPEKWLLRFKDSKGVRREYLFKTVFEFISIERVSDDEADSKILVPSRPTGGNFKFVPTNQEDLI